MTPSPRLAPSVSLFSSILAKNCLREGPTGLFGGNRYFFTNKEACKRSAPIIQLPFGFKFYGTSSGTNRSGNRNGARSRQGESLVYRMCLAVGQKWIPLANIRCGMGLICRVAGENFWNVPWYQRNPRSWPLVRSSKSRSQFRTGK